MAYAMWIGCAYWGWYVGHGKGRAVAGLILGTAFAFFGVAAIYLMRPRRKLPPPPPYNEPPAEWWPPQEPRGKHARR